MIRKNIRALSVQQRGAFVQAVVALKRDGTYDRFVRMHLDAMDHHQHHHGSGMIAHQGPAFLPWHRIYIRRFELELQRVDPSVSLPYWDWTQDVADPAVSPLWAADFMGGDGDSAQGYRVTTGAFAYPHWQLTEDVAEGGPALRRRLGIVDWYDAQSGQSGTMRYTLPARDRVDIAFAETLYDTAPWDRTPTAFRNRLEGWVANGTGANGLAPQLHNRVHVFVGGGWVEGSGTQRRNVSGTLQLASSPNDPIFFLHHCFCDKLWADWQRRRQQQDPAGAPHYEPGSGGPTGTNVDESMPPFGAQSTPRSCLDIAALGYSYEEMLPPSPPGPSPFAMVEPGLTPALPIDSGTAPPPGLIPSRFLPGAHSH